MTLSAPDIRRSPGIRPLTTGWTLRTTAGAVPDQIRQSIIPATVPGTVHTDLMAAGLIPDPYLDENERLLTWIGQADWEYSLGFEWTPDGEDRHDLVFEGLDTVATVHLNGVWIASTRNQHRTYRVAVDAHLRDGANELTVHFASPVKYADEQSLALGYRPHVNTHPYNAIRKAACNFGWDWGLDVATSGIWKPVSLHAWSGARLSGVRPTATVLPGGASGLVTIEVEIERADVAGGAVALDAAIAGSAASATVPAGESSATLTVEVPHVELWWPRGFGEQPLYALEVTAGGPQATDTRSARLGFRTVAVELEPDADGTSFRFVVNGQPVWARGANWIPDDAFFHRVDRARYAHRLDQAEFANINLLRVWGGGLFESDDFFDLCDERGILTWQDFLFACASYSEEEPLRGEIEAEVRDNVERLMPHSSLVLWNGNNENIWGYEEWGWEKRLQGKSWGLGYYLDLLPDLVTELDPSRAYTPGSPWSGDPAVFANSVEHGSVHLWEHWNREDYPGYRDVDPRFVAEFGWQGPASWSTITRAISDHPLTPESPGMLLHQKAADGNDKLTDGLVAHLPLPDDTEDWHWAMSLTQATAVAVGISYWRSLSPKNMGTVVWQLNDCWPVTSWSAVDGDGTAKPLLYALKHVYADRLLTIQPHAGALVTVVVNDSPEDWAAPLVLARRRFDGGELASETVLVDVPARSTLVVPIADVVAAASNVAGEVLVASLGAETTHWFYSEYRDSELAPAQLDTEVRTTAAGYSVTVTAHNLVRDIALLVDKVDRKAVVSDMLVTLLPGESVTFDVATTRTLAADKLVSTRVLRTANQLVADWGR
ncbi:MAG: glycoside hydrolase family 2 protein [Burkholderiaceae bacterium]|nr:glycoside hydrolase family 2 protein [Microbacteriaceae bacterium]